MSARLVVSQSVGESMTHIIRPVASQALQYVVSRLGYLEFFREKGDGIDIITDFETTSKAVDSNNNPKIVANRVRAKLNPNVNPSTNKWEGSGTTVDLGNGNMIIGNANGAMPTRTPWSGNDYTNRQYALFSDQEAFIDLFEKAVGSSLSMEVTMTFKEFVTANECLSRIFQCFQDGDMIGYVDVQYDYPVPMSIQRVMRYLYELRGKRSEADTCLQWVRDFSGGTITTNANRNDLHKTPELVVNKNVSQALFLIECSQDTPTQGPNDSAIITFNLTVQYARANRLVLQYPIIVNNQFVEAKCVPIDPLYRQGGDSPIMWDNIPFTEYWMSLYQRLGPQVYIYPWWDPWRIPNGSRLLSWGYKPIASIAFTLDDPENKEGVTEIDLKDGLPGIKLNEKILEIINSQKAKCFGILEPVNITVFADDFMLDPALMSIDDGHTLVIKKRRLCSTMRLVISLATRSNRVRNVNHVWIVTFYPVCESKVGAAKAAQLLHNRAKLLGRGG